MKQIFLLLLPVLAVLAGGCATAKLPAGDVDVYQKYASEIKILKSNLSPDSEMKFYAAKKIFAGVDFSFVKNQETLFSILGMRDARGIATGDGKQIHYRYRYQDKYILVNFNLSGDTIISVKIKDNF